MKKNLFIFLLCFWGGVSLQGQSISSAIPNQNPIQEGTSLTVQISGSNTNFAQGSSTTVTAHIGGVNVQGYLIGNVSNTNMTAQFNLPCGACGGADLTVSSLLDGSMTYSNAFNVTCAQITGVSPNTGSPGQTLSVSISGTNMNFTQGSHTWIYFNNPLTGDYLYTNANNGGTSNNITANLNVPSNSCGGSYDLTIFSNFGSCPISYPNALSITSNTGQITMVNPDVIQPGQTLPIGISGTGVNFLQGSLTVFFRNPTTGQRFYPSAYNATFVDSVNVDFSAPSTMCSGFYDVCVLETPNSCPTCFSGGLYVDSTNSPISIDTVYSSQGQGGQPLSLVISGTGLDFQQASSMYFQLVNSNTGSSVWSSYWTANPLSPNQGVVHFNYLPYDCGSYDLVVSGLNTCNNTNLTYPNAVTVNSTLNPYLYNAIAYPVSGGGQLQMSLSGIDMDFMQGSTTLSVRLVSPTTGTVLTGSNITPNVFNSSSAMVDFAASLNDCGDYNLEISNVPVGCGNTTTVVYHSLIGVYLPICNNSSQAQNTLPGYSSLNTSGPLYFKNGNGTVTQGMNGELPAIDEFNSEMNELSVKVYPNPMGEQATVEIMGGDDQPKVFSLYDILGKTVRSRDIQKNTTINVERKDLSSGMYLYRISDKVGNVLHVGKLELR